MKTLLPLVVTLILQAVFTALAAVFHIEAVRPEPAIVVLAFLAVRLDPVAGALVASAIGSATDLMALSPLGLHMLAFFLIYLFARLLSEVLGVTRASAALPLVLALSASARLLISMLLLLFADGTARLGSLYAHIAGTIVDALIAVPVWMLLEGLYILLVPADELGWKRP